MCKYLFIIYCADICGRLPRFGSTAVVNVTIIVYFVLVVYKYIFYEMILVLVKKNAFFKYQIKHILVILVL